MLDHFPTHSVRFLWRDYNEKLARWDVFKWQWRMKFERTPWSKVFHEKLTGFHLVKKLPTLYGSWRFIVMFTRSGYFSLPWSWSIQLIPYQPISLWSFLTLSSHLSQGLPSGLFSSGFPTITLHAPVLFPTVPTCPLYLILLDLVTRIIFGEKCSS